MQSNKPEILMRNFDFYNNATWQQVKPKIKAIIEQFQQQSKPQIEDLKSFYQDLEYDHSFIQWMFPNFYASKFNPNSYKLTLEERNRMIKSETIRKRFYKNYILILRFFGILSKSKQVIVIDLPDDSNESNQYSQLQTQTIQKQQNPKGLATISVQESQNSNQKQSENSKIKQATLDQFIKSNQQTTKDEQQQELVLIDKNQFELCCLRNTHNLLRLKRILSSLSVLKHRKEAIQLCQFLKKELTNLGREKVYQEYFSGFDRYDEELTHKELKKKKGENRYFNAYKLLYVDEDLVEKVDISIIQ
ncbi:unnamed protein product (macronuclear) [Paramecium tetraurelia]|uniref:Opioid growth factor receptor (OGFr) conserved domain-containing protein n=1 Tax=Paramecium tetraurelia TaxID=5888 RepID=A0DL46_PARTE|nr:uncharacterized protein GSPATT00018080001 [Paramecium tetraurelia]CAK83763.1 unnamed protein product [Paramecium tetraurelia]|eukprot:XP_001451160.1 hypothetical protein (macronuclear) [Paramecium tetraurelia strain d4-2]